MAADLTLSLVEIDGIQVFVPPEKPRVPAGWREIAHRPDGWMWERVLTGHKVILSGLYVDQPWIHLSLSYPSRLPTWAELVQVKEWAIGVESRAIQVLPPRSEYYNLHPYCLHLWSPLGFNPLPDFTLGGRGI